MSTLAVSNAGSAMRDGAGAASLVPAASPKPVADLKLVDLARAADANRLFNLEQLEVTFDEPSGALWAFMRARGRPSYNLDLLNDIHALQRGVVARFADKPDALRYLVAGSRTRGVFSLGGDLDLFAACVRAQDRQALVEYGKSCVRVLHGFHTALDLPIITLGVAQGDALGGGLESLLSFDVIVAERNAKFGFPEALFGLFPGMGAYSLVARRTSAALAEEMMLSGRTFTAEEMKEFGLVHIVAEPGQGVAAAQDYMQRTNRRYAGVRGGTGAKASGATVHFSCCSSGVNLKLAVLPSAASVT